MNVPLVLSAMRLHFYGSFLTFSFVPLNNYDVMRAVRPYGFLVICVLKPDLTNQGQR